MLLRTAFFSGMILILLFVVLGAGGPSPKKVLSILRQWILTLAKGDTTMTTKEEMNSIQMNAKNCRRPVSTDRRVSRLRTFLCSRELFVSGDAGTTASQIMASQGLFRMSIATE